MACCETGSLGVCQIRSASCHRQCSGQCLGMQSRQSDEPIGHEATCFRVDQKDHGRVSQLSSVAAVGNSVIVGGDDGCKVHHRRPHRPGGGQGRGFSINPYRRNMAHNTAHITVEVTVTGLTDNPYRRNKVEGLNCEMNVLVPTVRVALPGPSPSDGVTAGTSSLPTYCSCLPSRWPLRVPLLAAFSPWLKAGRGNQSGRRSRCQKGPRKRTKRCHRRVPATSKSIADVPLLDRRWEPLCGSVRHSTKERK